MVRGAVAGDSMVAWTSPTRPWRPPRSGPIAALNTAPARFVADLLEFFGSTYRALQGFPALPVHDPCAVAVVIDPAVLTTRRAPLYVELHGALTTGITVADLRGTEPAACHTRVAGAGPRPVLGPGRRRADPARRPLRPSLRRWSACSPLPTR